MKERPILFSGPMVRAILEGRKTQTRRVVKARQVPREIDKDADQTRWMAEVQGGRWGFGAFGATEAECIKELVSYGGCPYGRPGDSLWVREAWAPLPEMNAFYKADATSSLRVMLWKPSIHMPRWASRITLEIIEVRVQRLQEITDVDAVAEGIHCIPGDKFGWTHGPDEDGRYARHNRPAHAFNALWDSINGQRPGCAWTDNPWVWAVSFRRVP